MKNSNKKFNKLIKGFKKSIHLDPYVWSDETGEYEFIEYGVSVVYKNIGCDGETVLVFDIEASAENRHIENDENTAPYSETINEEYVIGLTSCIYLGEEMELTKKQVCLIEKLMSNHVIDELWKA